MQVCIFEDTSYRNFLPLVYLRPVYELRCGALSLRRKIELSLPKASVVLACRPVLEPLLAEEIPGRAVNALAIEDTWFINGRLIAGGGFGKFLRAATGTDARYLQGDSLAAAYLNRSRLAGLHGGLASGLIPPDAFASLPEKKFDGMLVRYPWDCVHHTADEITADFARLRLKPFRGRVPAGVHLIGRKQISIGRGTVLKPGVVIDATNGPVIIGSNVTIMPNAVVEGPAYIGGNSIIKIGAKIYHGTSIGPWCKAGGEIDASVIHSHSNKQHDGFLGHSYLGSWVNLGADTNTSDLKNTYGPVTVVVNGTPVDTGSQFVGLTMGDHSKSGINVMFDTGSMVGISCNIYGAGLPPKYLPSFSWGGDRMWSEYRIEKARETARRVMARRNVVMSEAYESVFREVFDRTVEERKGASIR